ncbi:MAG TPA: hypothetical protein VMF50_15965 [Candidatus Binataceae bacterium]|nr:hypothetical protein [Candidatus Binataceae bacterium]
MLGAAPSIRARAKRMTAVRSDAGNIHDLTEAATRSRFRQPRLVNPIRIPKNVQMEPPRTAAFGVVLARPNHRKAMMEEPKEPLVQSPHGARLSHQVRFIERVGEFTRHCENHECTKPSYLLKQALD